jgi:hypothetical protein
MTLSSSAFRFIWIGLFLALVLNRASGGGVVTSCDEGALRAALKEGGTVTFACDGIITLTAPLIIQSHTITNSDNEIVVRRQTTIDAAGHDVTISGGGTVGCFQLKDDLAWLQLRQLKVIRSGARYAIDNPGTVEIDRCMFRNCSSLIIDNRGILRVWGSTFFDNFQIAGVIHSSGGSLAITNSTFFNNTLGPVVNSQASADAFVVNCTFAGGSSPHILSDVGEVIAINSIFVGQGVSPSQLIDGGHNISDTPNPSFDHPTSIYDPTFAVVGLTANGGPTWTALILPDSKAVDGGDDLACPPTDQRGFARPIGSHCDIGATELQAIVGYTGSLGFANAQYSESEGRDYAAIKVIRTGDLSGFARVRVTAEPGTATAGADFNSVAGDLLFGPGQTERLFAVPLINDRALFDPDETVMLSLSNPGPGNLLGVASASLVIKDQLALVGFARSDFSAPDTTWKGELVLQRSGNLSRSTSVRIAGEVTEIRAPGQVKSVVVEFAPGETSLTYSYDIKSLVPPGKLALPIALRIESYDVSFTQVTQGAATLKIAFTEQTVADCSESALRAALVKGGRIKFGCDGVIPLTESLVITDSLELDANGHRVVLDSASARRMLEIRSGATVRLMGLAFENGGGVATGGAILNAGNLWIDRCVFRNNRATTGSSEEILSPDVTLSGTFGGAIFSRGYLVVQNSTFVGNEAGTTGGAIACPYTEASLGNAESFQLINCTFTGNSSGTVMGEGGRGLFVHCTFVGNQFPNLSAQFFPNFASINSIIEVGQASDSGGVGSPTINLIGTAELLKLSALGDFGGPTPTLLPLAGSPAIDAVKTTQSVPERDQRGVLRQYFGLGLDYGATEYTGDQAWFFPMVRQGGSLTFRGVGQPGSTLHLSASENYQGWNAGPVVTVDDHGLWEVTIPEPTRTMFYRMEQ